MSNDFQKADQIAFHFFTKLFYVVNDARATMEPRTQPKVDKWFNLETPDSDLFTKEAREKYKSLSASPSPPPLEIQVLLSIPELTHKQVLVYLAPDSSRLHIKPTPKHIVLESWTLSFTPHLSGEEDVGDVAPPTIYKHGIPFFRSLFSLLRILPAWSLFKRLRRRTGGLTRTGNLSIQLRVRNQEDDSNRSVLGFDTPPAANAPPLDSQSHTFPPVPQPMGTLSLSATYLTHPNFRLDELESLLSSRFLSLDNGPDFVPTLVKNHTQRSSMLTSGSSPSVASGSGSLPNTSVARALDLQTFKSKSKSPPESIADRFIISSRPSSTQPSASNAGLGPSASIRPSLPSSTSTPQQLAPSTISTSAFPTKDDSPPLTYPRAPSGLAVSRLRRESRGEDIPPSPTSPFTSPFALPSASSPSPLPIRRPHLNPVHPFKSNTLSQPSSLHSLHSIQSHTHSPAHSLRHGSPLSSTGAAVGSGTTPSPTTASRTGPVIPPPPIGVSNRPSPPFAPSSLGDRKSITSNEGVGGSGTEEGGRPIGMPTRKRYSSSFGHRYAPSVGGGSEGSAGSGTGLSGAGGADRKEGSPVFLNTNTHDDEISVFVQEIDARKPLSGRHRILDDEQRQRGEPSAEDERNSEQTRASEEDRSRDDDDDNAKRDEGREPLRRRALHQTSTDTAERLRDREARTTSVDESVPIAVVGPSSPPGAVLRSRDEVDARLRKMNEAFLASLVGLEGGKSEGGRRREGSFGSSTRSNSRGREGEQSGILREQTTRQGSSEDGGEREYGRGPPFVSSGLALQRQRFNSASTSVSEGMSQGSQEVVGRMELGEERRQSRYSPS